MPVNNNLIPIGIYTYTSLQKEEARLKIKYTDRSHYPRAPAINKISKQMESFLASVDSLLETSIASKSFQSGSIANKRFL